MRSIRGDTSSISWALSIVPASDGSKTEEALRRHASPEAHLDGSRQICVDFGLRCVDPLLRQAEPEASLEAVRDAARQHARPRLDRPGHCVEPDGMASGFDLENPGARKDQGAGRQRPHLEAAVERRPVDY